MLDQIDLDQRIRILARTAKPVIVRSLDAIHLGTALHSRPRLTSFVIYDKRLLDSARAVGLPSTRLAGWPQPMTPRSRPRQRSGTEPSPP